jgi:hypothetical protein
LMASLSSLCWSMARGFLMSWNGRHCWCESESTEIEHDMFPFESALVASLKSKWSERAYHSECAFMLPRSFGCARPFQERKAGTFRALAHLIRFSLRK